MTDVIDNTPAAAAPKKLPKFEGRDVIRSAVQITKAGDGLSDALKVEPVALRHGQEVAFVLRGVVRSVNHPPVEKDSDLLVRTHVIDTTEIAIVDDDAIADMLAEHHERVQTALDSMAGQERLDDPEHGSAATKDATDEVSAKRRGRKPKTDAE